MLSAKKVEVRGIPHLAKNERDAPEFPNATPSRVACAAFIKESRMQFIGPTDLHGNPGMWGTLRSAARKRHKLPRSRRAFGGRRSKIGNNTLDLLF